MCRVSSRLEALHAMHARGHALAPHSTFLFRIKINRIPVQYLGSTNTPRGPALAHGLTSPSLTGNYCSTRVTPKQRPSAFHHPTNHPTNNPTNHQSTITNQQSTINNQQSTTNQPANQPSIHPSIHPSIQPPFTLCFHDMLVHFSPDVDGNRAVSRYGCLQQKPLDPICFTMCLFISPDLDGHRAPKVKY